MAEAKKGAVPVAAATAERMAAVATDNDPAAATSSVQQ